MMDNDWLLYIVANTVSPYGLELPVILAYPEGCFYRARFKTEWVDPVLLEAPRTLVGSRTLIVYRDFASGDIYPIRFGTVAVAQRYGDVLYLEYQLDEVVPYPASQATRAEQLAQFRRAWMAEHHACAATNLPGDHMRPLVFRSRFWPDINNPYLADHDPDAREFESWSNICQTVAHLPIYAEVDFLRVIEIRDLSDDRRVRPVKNRYRLKADRFYELRLAQQIFRAAAQVAPHTVEFTCDGYGVHAMTRHRNAVGKYDILSFKFRTRQTGGERATGVLAVTGHLTNDETVDLEFTADIRPRWRVLTSLGAVVGVTALMFPNYVASVFPGAPSAGLVEKAAIVLFVVSAIDARSIFSQLLRR
jgi:hypothetical protein